MDELDDKKEKDVKDAEALVVEANYAKWSAQQKISSQGRGGVIDNRGGRGTFRGYSADNRGIGGGRGGRGGGSGSSGGHSCYTCGHAQTVGRPS